MIDWLSPKSHILLNPALPKDICEKATNALPMDGYFSNHLWLTTSGSTASDHQIKYAAISKQAFLASAAAVNKHLNIDHKDIWINPLPLFHVGGLAITARAFLSHSHVIPYEGKWNARKYCESINQNHGSLSSLVPTQVFDLVSENLSAPPSIRKIIVGGGHLSPLLQEKAFDLGWPLFPSYGMTEASSQIATALNNQSALHILPHLQVKVENDGFLSISGPSLLTCYGYLSSNELELIDPKVDGWLKTEDKGMVDGSVLTLFGREAHFIKIGGENVNMLQLESILENLKLKWGISRDMALFALEDQRLGHAVHLAIEGQFSADIKQMIDDYQTHVLPFERIQQTHCVPKIPRSPLNKLLRNELMSIIRFYLKK